jgi:chemotaxis protein MotA
VAPVGIVRAKREFGQIAPGLLPADGVERLLNVGGVAFVLFCVFGMYIITGGALLPLLWAMPFGFVTIGGASVGILVAGNSRKVIGQTLNDLKKVAAGSRFHKVDYVDLLCLLFFLVKLDAAKGALALEGHIEDAGLSPAFQYFPKILANRTVTAMVCDYLRIVGLNADDPYQIEDLMARELKKILAEELRGAHALRNIADGIPALGIVVAVLGVMRAMGHMAQPRAVVGAMIADALVGTFLGVLLAYGVVAPISNRITAVVEEDAKYFEVIRAVLVAHLHGNAPQVSVEMGRKMAPSEYMPDYLELEEQIDSFRFIDLRR